MKLEIELPEVLGVMVLPGVLLFPGSLVPLYIFEPRYRKMLADALATQRVFGIVPHAEAEGGRHGIGGAGLIRACVGNEDGTSHLVLLGISRFHIVDWVRDRGYPAVKPRMLESHYSAPGEVDALQKEITRLCRSLARKGREMPPHFENAVSMSSGPAEFSDLVASTLVGDPSMREHLFHELDASRRLEILADYLAAENLK
ncbi:ATP-dependent Lon protease [Terrimicrobium sacchariphilum]|uniref:ATP-dependent Lon protease n=1 Tax=Terrimicrobium sacchariphilum TaxID=690879 RepID=A0A146G7A6_TERSA|nr:LON peptidase substrate-binding domain-containing protein [Terrimicrobium sacchariphilum]GAT32794.1 ATP-dependent Lon protease [Terrimicrobium sacchariphilum]